MSEPSPELGELLAVQRAAFRADMAPSRAVRAERLERLARLIETHADAFAAAIGEDFAGRSAIEIRLTETMLVGAGVRHARRALRRWMRPERVRLAPGFWPARARIVPRPVGVVGIVSPWNYPLALSVGPLTAALAAGNRAMLKPSELTPRFSDVLARAVAEHFEPSEVTVVTGGPGTGIAFCALGFDHLLFTGSTEVGRMVAQSAARTLTPVTLELGGKSPAIVDESADLASAAARLAWGKLINAGQTCVAPDYVLAPRARVDELVAALTASMRRSYPVFVGGADYTSIISDTHRERLAALVDDARAHGARVVEVADPSRESAAHGRQLAPVLLLDVDSSMRVMREEIFGPVLPIVPYDSVDEAIAFVTARAHPLALYWFGRDRAARRRVLDGTLAGGAVVNDTLLHFATDGLPFGGVGASGIGHYHGVHGFRTLSKHQPVLTQSRLSAMKLLYPPYGPRTERILRVVRRLV